MSDDQIERRLAAILAADIVGYSRLMEANEEGTLAILRQNRRELLDPTVARHRGRIFKVAGDGFLIEFPSVVDVLRCAMEIQASMPARNSGLPEDRHLCFRMGVHVGDVLIEGDDVYGEGVNIASRLEGIAAPGTICLSEDAYRQVRSRLDLLVNDLGQTRLKNIAEPIRIYSLEVGVSAITPLAMPAQPTATSPAAPTELPDKPSIAVLPFVNMSGDAEQDYFSDGITEDIISSL